MNTVNLRSFSLSIVPWSRKGPRAFHPQFGFAIRGKYQAPAYDRPVAQTIQFFGGYDDRGSRFNQGRTPPIGKLFRDDSLETAALSGDFVQEDSCGHAQVQTVGDARLGNANAYRRRALPSRRQSRRFASQNNCHRTLIAR